MVITAGQSLPFAFPLACRMVIKPSSSRRVRNNFTPLGDRQFHASIMNRSENDSCPLCRSTVRNDRPLFTLTRVGCHTALPFNQAYASRFEKGLPSSNIG